MESLEAEFEYDAAVQAGSVNLSGHTLPQARIKTGLVQKKRLRA